VSNTSQPQPHRTARLTIQLYDEQDARLEWLFRDQPDAEGGDVGPPGRDAARRVDQGQAASAVPLDRVANGGPALYW
jgi:hypothetical protein